MKMCGKMIEKYRLKELEAILLLVEDLIEEAVDSQEKSEDSNYLLFTIGKCLVTMREIIILCANGLPDGALALSRNLYEQMIITVFIEMIEDKEERRNTIEKYNDDYQIQMLKNRKYAYSLTNNLERNEGIKEDINKILSKYDIKKPSEYWWANGVNNFASMCEMVENNDKNKDIRPLLSNAHILYKRACLVIHASSIGNQLRLGSNSYGIDIGPWVKGQEYALYLAVVSFISIIGYTAYRFNITTENTKKINNTLNQLAIYYDNIAIGNQKE